MQCRGRQTDRQRQKGGLTETIKDRNRATKRMTGSQTDKNGQTETDAFGDFKTIDYGIVHDKSKMSGINYSSTGTVLRYRE